MFQTLSLIFCIGAAASVDWNVTTPLDEYVQGDDGYYTWDVLATYRYDNLSCTLHVVNMTSQKWMDETYVDRPYWWHLMSIGVPDEANLTYPDAGVLLIRGSSNDDDPPGEDDSLNSAICTTAVDTGSVAGVISQIPNQPLYFKNDPTNDRRTEDEVIAWTWRTYLDDPNPDPTVIARFPMTKAAKRGLDTIHEVSMMYHPYTDVTRFAVLGPSKRGWTTYSLAATDQRVIAMAPLVFSLIKMNETLMVHYQSLGGAWSFAFEPYYAENLTREFLSEKTQEIFMHEDMWNYRERFTIPLLQMVATGDEFFLLQDSHQWWDDIPDPKWTCMFENADHVLFPHYVKIYETATAFWIAVLSGWQLPTVTWDRGETEDGGYIDYYVDMEPEEITVFRASTLQNDTIRDFRLAHLDEFGEVTPHSVRWSESNTTLEVVAPGHYRATVDQIPGEWVGFLVRGMWRGPDDKRIYITSETQVVPDTFPVPPCTDGDSCYGTLV